jgi:hypothetical protein
MVLLHGGSPTGAERIAARWADDRKVAHIPSSPTGPEARQGRALQAQRPDARSPADRRHRLPGSGIQENLADKARKLGIPVWRFGSGGA